MFDCHKDILDYHNEHVTLSSKERSKMKERRNANRRRIRKNLQDDDPRPIGFNTQGSYAMRTMVMDHETDYDIDDGIYFEKTDLVGPNRGDFTPRKIKKNVCDAATDASFNKPPEVRTNCVRVYYNDGSHVDVPVYRRIEEKGFLGSIIVRYEIARAEWKESDPKAVTAWFNERNRALSPDTKNGRQFRRIVRLLKKFTRSRSSWKSRIASGFVITSLAAECYNVNEDREDKALYDTMVAIHNRLKADLEVHHPVLTGELLAEDDDSKTAFLRDKLEEKLDKLDMLFEDDCDHPSALEAWNVVFGSTFFF